MKVTHEQWIAGGAILLTLLLTLGPIFDVGVVFSPSTTQMLIQPRSGDLVVIPADRPTRPLLDDLSGNASANPFTLKPNGGASRLPAPPAPPLELPAPPALPLPEKDK
jgi:hypothetical protein